MSLGAEHITMSPLGDSPYQTKHTELPRGPKTADTIAAHVAAITGDDP